MVALVMIIVYFGTLGWFPEFRMVPSPFLLIPIFYLLICLITFKFPIIGQASSLRWALRTYAALYTGKKALVASLILLIPLLIFAYFNIELLIPSTINLGVLTSVVLSLAFSFLLYIAGVKSYEQTEKYRQEKFKGLPLESTRL